MNLSGKVTNVLAKTAGVVGLGLVLIDAHTAGKIEAPKNEKNIKTEALTEHYLNDMSLDSPSVVKSAVKKKIFNFYADEHFTDFFTNAGGYINGFSSMLVKNVVPLGLSIGTLLAPKGIITKLFGAGLVVYGGIFLLQEMFGIGKSHE